MGVTIASGHSGKIFDTIYYDAFFASNPFKIICVINELHRTKVDIFEFGLLNNFGVSLEKLATLMSP